MAGAAGRAGLDVRPVAGSQLAGSADWEILNAAIADGRVLVTYEIGDFVPLFHAVVREGRSFSGLVFVREKTISSRDVKALVRALVRLARAVSSGAIDPAGGVFLRRQ